MTATQNVSQDTEHVNVQLAASAPYASLGGIYRLVFRARRRASFPTTRPAARTRRQFQVGPGATLTVLLSDAQFWSSGSVTWNRFTARVIGNMVSFTLWDGITASTTVPSSSRRLDNRYLSFVGTAQSTVTAPLVLRGVCRFRGPHHHRERLGADRQCTAPDHQLIFTPVSAGGQAGARR